MKKNMLIIGAALASDCSDKDAESLAHLTRDVVRACLVTPMPFDKFSLCLKNHGVDLTDTCSHCWFNVSTLLQTCAKPCQHDMTSPECQHCIETAQEAIGKCMGDDAIASTQFISHESVFVELE